MIELPEKTVTFFNVPTLQKTWRAAVFHVAGEGPLSFEIVPGTEPAPPFGLTAYGPSVTYAPSGGGAPFDPVRVWFQYASPSVTGASASQVVRIRCVETTQVFEVMLRGIAVRRPRTGIVFCLDKSGSMGEPAGTGRTRMEVLHEAAFRCLELIYEGNGAGMVSFNQDSYLGSRLKPFYPTNGHFGDVMSRIAALVPGGDTSIGDGVDLAHSIVHEGDGVFEEVALVVLTDGLENSPRFLGEVAGWINSRTFAIGLGAAHEVSAEMLARLTKGTDGYLMITGPLTPDTEGFFRLSKYFQQILTSATNDQVVTDPMGILGAGEDARIPFDLTEADIEATVIALLDVPSAQMSLETPSGRVLEEGELEAIGAPVQHGTKMTFCRFRLPLAGDEEAQGGRWHALLSAPEGHYSLTVNSWSDLRLQATLEQSGFEPGDELLLKAVLTEYDMPVEGRANVTAEVTLLTGGTIAVELGESGPGIFEASTNELMSQARVKASGETFRGSPFTREQLLTAVFAPPESSPPVGPG